MKAYKIRNMKLKKGIAKSQFNVTEKTVNKGEALEKEIIDTVTKKEYDDCKEIVKIQKEAAFRLSDAEGYSKITTKDIKLIETFSKRFEQPYEDWNIADLLSDVLAMDKLSRRINRKLSHYSNPFKNPRFFENFNINFDL